MERLKNIDEALKSAEEKKKSAAEAQKRAERDQKDAEASIQNLQKAKKLSEEAAAKLKEAEKYCPTLTQGTVVMNGQNGNAKKQKKNGSTGKGIVIGAISMATVIAVLAGGYKLCKEIKAGNIKLVIKNNPTVSTVVDDDGQLFTKEEYEKIVAEAVRDMDARDIELSEDNIRDYVTYVNADELASDNPEFLAELINGQDSVAIQHDADNFTSAGIMTNYTIWFAEENTEGYVRASDYIFDEEEKAKLVELENRINDIAVVYRYKDYARVDELTHKLLLDLSDPTCSLSTMANGTGYASQMAKELLRGLYGMNFEGDEVQTILSEETLNLLKYHVPYSEDDKLEITEDDKYTDNNLHNGYIRNINALLGECGAYQPTMSSYDDVVPYTRKRTI